MSQVNPSQSAARHSHHILIVDDSARLRYALADLIVAACQSSGKPYRLFHCDKTGKFIESEANAPTNMQNGTAQPRPSNDPNRVDEFAVYTAPSPKQALFVINSPLFTRLTIICDVMMPADTEVGLVGMLSAISRRSLPVNLVFASSDQQNRYVVAQLVENGKAYFVLKAGGVWEELSQALVHRTDSFQFKVITSQDFAGIGGASNYALGTLPDRTPGPSTYATSPQMSAQPAAVTNRPTPARPPIASTIPAPEPAVRASFNPFRPFVTFFRNLLGR